MEKIKAAFVTMREIKIIICYEEVHKINALDVTKNYVVVFLFLFDDLIKKNKELFAGKINNILKSSAIDTHSVLSIHCFFLIYHYFAMI